MSALVAESLGFVVTIVAPPNGAAIRGVRFAVLLKKWLVIAKLCQFAFPVSLNTEDVLIIVVFPAVHAIELLNH
jgi:hypothetical protein